MTWLINIAYLAAAVLYFPVLVYQWTVQKKNRRGWRQRFGRLHLPPPTGPRVWIHAVSLGEVNCTPTMARELTAARPELDIVVSTTTDTGFARACKLYPSDRVFRYPLDLSWIVRRALKGIQPDLIVLVEQEVWPNLVSSANRGGIPIAVINGRLTERSAGRLAKLEVVTRRMFNALDWVGAQDDPIAGRFRRVGVRPDRITETGSLKWDTAEIADAVPGADALANALGLSPARPLWVCGSTGPGEEEMVLDAYRALIQGGDRELDLAIIPRKPERFDEVAELIRKRGFDCSRRTDHPDGVSSAAVGAVSDRDSDPEAVPKVILGDTMGELRKFYSLAAVVFVGRSLVPMGGSDPMEVAALAKPILCGPHMENFEFPTAALQTVGSLRTVAGSGELAAAVIALTHDPNLGQARGRAGRDVVIHRQGATRRTTEHLLKLLPAPRAK